MPSKIKAVLLGIVYLFAIQRMDGQLAVIRTTSLPNHAVQVVTPFGETSASVTRLDPSPDLLIAIAKDTLAQDDYPEIRRLIASLYKSLHSDTIVRVAILRQGAGLEIAGPFRSAAELQTVLRRTTPDSESPTVRDAGLFIPALADGADPDPPRWGAMLVLGRIPDFPLTVSPSVSQYAAAWLGGKTIAQKRTLLFRDISGSPLPQWAVFAAGATGGIAFAPGEDPAAILAAPSQFAAVSWDTRPPTSGFDVQMARIIGFDDLPNLALPSISGRSVLPDPRAYLELAALREALRAAPGDADPATLKGTLDKALAINPSDREAVAFGIGLAKRRGDATGEVALLATAVELTPNDAALWSRLGDLQYERRDFGASERALVRARELGAREAASSEKLGRMRFDQHDLSHAADYIDESLSLDPAQQSLWFFAADLGKELGHAPRRTEALEHALALGGNHVDRRIELIRIYLTAGDRANASRHADLELPSLPPDADTQSTWADFYETLGRPNDALACWKRVIAADPKRESANYAASAILFAQNRYPEALDAAEHGLETNGSSGRLELVKVNSLERLNRIYDLRHSIEEFSSENADVAILRRRAEVADSFGGEAPAAWKRYAEALLGDGRSKSDVDQVLARGWRVCLREGDLTTAVWFEEHRHMPNQGVLPDPGPAKKGIWIPGGFDALAFVAGGQSGSKAGTFLVEYSRTVISRLSEGTEKEHELYRRGISAYFEQLKQLIAMSAQTGNRAILTLSLANKQSQSQTEAVLNMFGWKIRRTKQQIAVESDERSGQSRKQDLPSALGVDQVAMQEAFRAGKSFRIEIPFEWAPMVLDENAWRTTLQTDRYTGGLAEVMSQRIEVARVYLGLSNVDGVSAATLAYDVGLPALLNRYAGLLALYSSALSISGGRVVVPGGKPAESVWTKLGGASPADPARFYRGLLEKDNGKLMAWFFALSQLDTPHQHFFTRSEKRTAAFYDAFSTSGDIRTGASTLMRRGTFSEFLREIPLDGENVDFPGSPEIWMVAQGHSVANRQTARLLQKARKMAAPDVEDEILLRLARTTNKADNESTSEIDNFLAVTRIDQHRRSGVRGEEAALDDEAALLLAQNYVEFASFYPYFTAFRDLSGPDLKSLFDFLARMRTADTSDADTALGQFYAVTELTRLAMEFGGIPEARGNQAFRSLCARFLAAPDNAGFVSAALDTIHDLIRTSSDGTDADTALRRAVLGGGPAVDLDWQGALVQLDDRRNRERAFRRVLDLQKVPSLALLLRIDETVRRIAAGNTPLSELIAALVKDVASLPSVEIPKTLKAEGNAKTALLRTVPVRLAPMVEELRLRASKKKVNAEEIRKTCHEILTELAPQAKIALIGLVYAVYLGPDNILVADDPLLVRKHQAHELGASTSRKNRFAHSELISGSTGEGSFFLGGFGGFAIEAARAGVPPSAASSSLYANQLAAIRTTPWAKFSDDDQRLLGLRVRMAREWCVYAADDAALLSNLAEDTLGILSLTRRRLLLSGIAAHDWESVWASVTVSDLLYLSGRYAVRYAKSPWNSPVDAALRQSNSLGHVSSFRLLGALPVSLYGCNHPDRVLFAPYEEYERHLFPGDMAERAAEMKLYLALALDRNALPAGLMPSLAEPIAKIVFGNMRMSDTKDWSSAMKAFSAIDEKAIGKALQESK